MEKINLVVGLGPSRCMTSWFHNQLEQNDNFFVPPRKEMRMLNITNFDDLIIQRYAQIMFKKKKICVDYSVDYSENLELVQNNLNKLKKKYKLNIKYLFFFREPFARLISHTNFYLYRKRIKNFNKIKLTINEQKSIINQSLYYEKLKNLDLENTFFYNVKDIINNPHKFKKNIQSFLFNSNFNINLNKSIGSNYVPRFYLLEKIRKYVFFILEKYDLEIIFRAIKLINLHKFLKLLNSRNIKINNDIAIKNYFKHDINRINDSYIKFISSIKYNE